MRHQDNRFDGILLGSIAALLLTGLSMNAQRPGSVDTSFQPRFESSDYVEVNELVEQSDGRILLVGRFTAVNGQPAGDIVRLMSDGSTDPSFNTGTGFYLTRFQTPGRVNRIVVLEDGRLVVVGLFDTFDGQPAHNMVRLNPDGSLDPSFDSGSGAMVDSAFFPVADPFGVVRLSNGKFIVSGAFMLGWDDHRSEGIVRINADGSVDTEFKITIERIDEGPVALGVRYVDEAGRIFVNSPGFISRYGNVARFNDVAFNDVNFIDQDGNLDQEFAAFYGGIGINGRTFQWQVLPGGKFLVSGAFTEIKGVPTPGTARLNPDGSVDPTFVVPDFFGPPWVGGPGATAELAPAGNGKLWASVFFSHVNGVARNCLALLNSDGSLDESFDPGLGPRDAAGDLAYAGPIGEEINGRIYIVGGFTSFDGVEQPGIVRLYTGTPFPVKINSVSLGTGGVATLDFTKSTEAGVILEATEDFAAWSEAGRNNQPAGTYQIQDPGATGTQRFYRFRLE